MTPAQSADDGAWIQTWTGRVMHPVEPDPSEIEIDDIANALARQCRYGGHCLRFYSVAEHCVLLADYAAPEHAFCALMHDASEAYLIDIPRPLKPALVGYHAIEDRLMMMIAAKFDFRWPPAPEVKRLDAAIVTDERHQNMESNGIADRLWGATLPALGVTLQFWTPEIAAIEFLTRFHRLRS